MFKNTQFKIIVIFFVVGIILIGTLGAFYIYSLEIVKTQINVNNIVEIGQVVQEINQIKHNTIVALGVVAIVFAIIGCLISAFLSEFVIYPINKLIKSAERVTDDDSKNKVKNKKKRNDVDDLESAFGLMTTELNEKLSEVSTQKNQIETILLHMTDGIIAFNRKGQIILINPAAKKFLAIRPEDENFDDIFKKFSLNINMEKIIYLENWTSTEQRIQVDDRYVNVFFAPFKNETERPDGVIAVIQDITEHVKLDNMQKELVADVSHELKTPITSIMGYADTLLEGEYDKETQNKFLNVIATEARRMARLVTDLLTLSRYDSNKKRII